MFSFAFGATVIIHLLHCQKTADNLEIIKSLYKKHSSDYSFPEKIKFLLKIFILFLIRLPLSARFCGITSVQSIRNFQPNVRLLRDILMLLLFIRNQYSKHWFLAGFLIPGVLHSHYLFIYIFIYCQLSLLLCLQ